MSGIRSVYRGTTVKGYATDASAPLYVDKDDNILKMVPAGEGTTEVQVVDASASQTLTNKTLSGAALNGTLSGAPTFSGVPTLSAGFVDKYESLTTAGAVSQYGLSNIAIASSSNGTTAYTLAAPIAGVRKALTCSTNSTGGVSTVTLTTGTYNGTNTIATFSSQGFLQLYGLSSTRWMITALSTSTVTFS